MTEAEDIYPIFFENIPFAALLVDLDGFIINLNPITEKMLGFKKEELISKNFLEFFSSQEYSGVLKHYHEAILKGFSLDSIEIPLNLKDKNFIWVKFQSAIIHLRQKRLIQIIVQDITKQKLAEEALRESFELEKVGSLITSRFLGVKKLNEAIDKTLADIGRLSDASRAYIFLLSDDKTQINNTHEWCAEGVVPQKNNLQNLFIEHFLSWMKKLCLGKIINVGDISELSDEDKAEKEILKGQSIKSLLLLPVLGSTRTLGFIGLDQIQESRHWSNTDIKLLQISSQAIGAAVERKQAEDKLGESEEKYRLITENVSDSISIINSDFNYEYVNNSFSKLVGYFFDDVRNINARDLIHPSDHDKLKTYLREIFKRSEAIAEVRFKKKNGEYIWIESRGKVFTGTDGKQRLLSVSRDITEKILIEETLNSKTSDCMFVVEPKTRRILKANYAFQHLFAYSVEEIQELSIYDIVAQERRVVDAKIHQILKEQSSFLGEQLYRKKDGSKVEVEVRAGLITYRGQRAINVIAHDITVRKLMEKKLEESEKKYRNIIENVKDAVVIIGFDGKLHYQSPQFTKLVGREILGDDLIAVSKFIHTDDVQKLLDTFWKSAKEHRVGSTPEVEFRALHQKGYYIWLASSTKPHYNEEGNVDGYLITLRDISEQKSAIQKVKESEEKYRHLFEKTPFAIILANNKGEIIDCNHVTSQYLGYSKEELIGKNFQDMKGIIQFKDFPLLIRMFEILLKGTVPDPLELQISTKDGNFIWVDIQASFIEVGGNKYIQGIVRNITERKEAELKLTESEEKYRELFENSPNSIILMDISGTIRECNSATIQYFGFEKEELIGNSLGEISSVLVEKAKNRLTGSITEPVELLIHKKDGSLLWVSLEASIIEFRHSVFIQARIQDITARKLAEQKLKESEEQIQEKSKLAAEGQLEAGVAHELNTPLANINLTAEYLENFLEKENRVPNPDLLRSEILDIKKQVKFCAKIVKDLLQFSRKIEIKKQIFSISTLLTEIMNYPALKKQLKESNIQISLGIQEDVSIKGDQTLISQVIQNLIENSIDALEVISRQPQIVVRIGRNKNKLEIKIKDNGKGIRNEDITRIFEPFFTTKGVGKGTGLGLSISRGIVEKHGGELTIKSVFSRGTEATIILPTD